MYLEDVTYFEFAFFCSADKKFSEIYRLLKVFVLKETKDTAYMHKSLKLFNTGILMFHFSNIVILKLNKIF